MNKHDFAKALSAALVTEQRDNGETFVKLKEDHPEWMTTVVREAHSDGAMLPDDKRYSMIRECVGALHERADWDDLHEAIEGLVDIPNMDRAKWLASHLDRAGYCDEGIEEGGFSNKTSIWDILGEGQYREYREIMNSLVDSFAELEEQEGNDEDEKGNEA